MMTTTLVYLTLLLVLFATQVLSFFQPIERLRLLPHLEANYFTTSLQRRTFVATSTMSTATGGSTTGLQAKPPIEVVIQPDEAFLEKKG
jgi:hypothetical protein